MKKKEIQVLYIITKLELGGAQKICLSLLNGLQHNGCKSILISGDQGTLVPEVVQNIQEAYLLDTFTREVSVFFVFKEIKNFINLIKLIGQLHKKYPHLIIHTHSTKAGLLGRWAGFFAGVPRRIHTVHGFGFHPYQNKLGWLINYTFELITSFITTHYICVSSYDVKTGIQLLPKFDQKHSIIRAAVDYTTFKTACPCIKKDTTPFIFGTIACFKKQKNLFDLLQAFAQCHQHNPHVKLEVVGDGTLRPALETWIKNHNLQEHITLHGWQKNVHHVMKSWHAFVLSSLWEGLPCAVVEARMLKLPVICYDTGGIHDVIDHQGNGLLCKPKNIAALAYNMTRLLQEPHLYKTLQEYQDDLQNFDDQAMIKEHIELYKSV